MPETTAEIDALLPELIAIRRDLHKHPELGFEEHRTGAIVRAWLERHGYAHRTSAKTGVVADLRGSGAAPTIALRADLDCLPMPETTDLPHRSIHDGRAHKCGHDGHTTILLGVAALLARRREQLGCNVRLLFQPAEEGVDGGGAKVMVAEGALAGIEEVYGLHNWPGFRSHRVHVRAGAMLAQTHWLSIKIHGVGGHASQPQLCRDVVVAGSHLVVALQTVVARGLGYEGGAVVSIGKFAAGTTDNVLPGSAELEGTVRTFAPEVTERVLSRIREIVSGIATTFGVRTELELVPGYPVVMNDAVCADAVRRVGAGVVGPGQVCEDGLPIAGGEDFAYMAQATRGAFFFVGTGDDAGTVPTCHHPDFDFDDTMIPIGIRMFLGLVEDHITRRG